MTTQPPDIGPGSERAEDHPTPEQMEAMAAAARGDSPPAPAQPGESAQPQADQIAIWGDAEAAEIARKKGWKSAADMAKAYASTSSEASRMSDELAVLRNTNQELIDFLQRQEAERAAAAANGQPGQITPEQQAMYAQMYDPETGEFDPVRQTSVLTQAVAKLLQESVPNIVRQELAPRAEAENRQAAELAREELAALYGERDEQIAESADRVLADDPDTWAQVEERLGTAQALRLLYASGRQLLDAEEAINQREQAAGYVITESGRLAPPAARTPEDAEREAIMMMNSPRGQGSVMG